MNIAAARVFVKSRQEGITLAAGAVMLFAAIALTPDAEAEPTGNLDGTHSYGVSDNLSPQRPLTATEVLGESSSRRG